MDNALQYEVPEGQDPAVLVSALRGAGYEAGSEEVGGRRLVTAATPDGTSPDREDVRGVIASAPSMIDAGVPLEGRVAFEDERRT